MLIKLTQDCSNAQQEAVCDKIGSIDGLRPHVEQGVSMTIITVVGEVNGRYETLIGQLGAMPGVSDVIRIGKPYQLAARKYPTQKTVVDAGNNVKIGGENLVLVAGPCSVESEQQMRAIAGPVHAAGATILRGGAFKPRTNPRGFEGLGEDGLRILRDVAGELGMATQTEVMDTRKVELVTRYADILQIGARNMQNYDLLDEVGKTRKPVVLKRGPAATFAEWFGAAERILDGGNPNVILCERGIRAFDPRTRNLTDVTAIPVVHQDTHLPAMLDPSHGTGKTKLIPDVTLAGVAAGADALHHEVHHKPSEALSDGDQALLPEEYALLAEQMLLMRRAQSACLALRDAQRVS